MNSYLYFVIVGIPIWAYFQYLGLRCEEYRVRARIVVTDIVRTVILDVDGGFVSNLFYRMNCGKMNQCSELRKELDTSVIHPQAHLSEYQSPHVWLPALIKSRPHVTFG